MTKYLSALAVTLFIAQAAPGVAAETEGAKPKKERKICKPIAETATRMTGRTCLTPTQWRAVARRDKQNEIAEADGDRLRSGAETPGTAAPRN